MKLKELITFARQYLLDTGYTKATIYHNYVWHWNQFFKSVGDSEYTYILMADYISNRFGRNLFQVNISEMNQEEYRNYHALFALNSFHDTATMPGTSLAGSSVRQPLTELSNQLFAIFMNNLDDLEYSSNSKRQAKGIVHSFLLACPIETVNDDIILDYLSGLGKKAKTTVKSELKLLKRFFLFIWESGFTKKDFSILLISTKKRRNTEIPSIYSPDEIVMLLNHLSNNGRNRLRNYTIALLIAVYGFRAGDIASMKLENIDWDRSILCFVQSKTSRCLEHKLTELCGNALAEYLLNERPKVDNEYVFLKENGSPLVPTSISTMIFQGFLHSNVKIGNRKHGSHSLRHSLASNMLKQGSGILEISHILGHSSVDTTRNFYSKVDIEHLRLCELEVPVYE